MFKLGSFAGGFTVGASKPAVARSVQKLNANIIRIHGALAPVCGKTLSVNFDSDPMYGCCTHIEIVATGKDMSAHVLPYLKNEECMWDYGEDWWMSDFGQDTPVLKPRKQYHLTVNTASDYFVFRERCVVDGVVAF